ncbi:ATP-binding protein [Aquabacterium sp.]|uniref:hybrid sensor histidine kinase/response regulator n=1 Tax=Aquabacterium sp. TaxID=1872578 RepID=UPI002488444E|nr:ATP-binding protein [Aquabacterium sp.]MDI1260909.1 ATP-binding protein [Aquabacterium sp.]
MRIRSHLFLVAAVALIPGFLAAAIAIEKVREGERLAALKGLHETVRATSLMVDGELQRALGSLTALGASEHLQTGNLRGFYDQALAINRAPDVWTLLLDETGTQVLNTVVPFGTPPPPAAARQRVAQVLATQRPLVTDLIVGPVTGKLLTTVYLPTKAFGGRQYVVAQAFSVEHWKKAVLQTEVRRDWVVAVIDHSGRFISRSKNAANLLGKQARPELVAAAAASHDGLIRHNTLEGIESYDAFTHSDLTGWTIAVAAPVQSIEASASQAVALLTAGVLLALAGATATSLVLAHKFILAMNTASTAARRLATDQRQLKVARTSVHEVNVLNDALAEAGRLLEADRHAKAELAQQRLHLLDIETRAREEAQAQNAAKDQFLALLGHELRNPLSAIAGATAILGKSQDLQLIDSKYLGMIQRQSKHLRHIVNDLLDVSRMLSGKIVLERQPLNLAECLHHCIEALQATDRGAGRRFVVEAEEVWLDGDIVRIEQVLSNLLTNALKYSPVDKALHIRVQASGTLAVVEIRDFGMGMSPALLPRIFEPFLQGPALSGNLQSGLGIGLALVKQLVELHDGEVKVHSDGEGLGSTFTVTWPLIPSPHLARSALSDTTRSACKILLIEDNVDTMEATAELLRFAGHHVVEAQDGDQGLAMAATSMPDVVVMDIGLPRRDGYEIAAELKQSAQLRHIPLIALTGYGQQRPGAGSSNFSAFLVKPVDPDLLLQAIDDQLQNKPAKAGSLSGAG